METTLHDDIARVRAEITDACEELAWLEESPVPPEELKARAKDGCRALAARFVSRLGSLANPGARIDELVDMFSSTARVHTGQQPVTMTSVELGPVLAWALGDQLVKKLVADIDRMDYRPGPPLAERPAALAELRKQLRALEEREELLILRAEELNVDIPRRPDADAAVILGYDPNGVSPDLGPRRFGSTILVGQ